MAEETKEDIAPKKAEKKQAKDDHIEETKEDIAPKKAEKRQAKDDHIVFVGSKPFMNYVTGVVMQFTTQGADEVAIKARGKFITRAVDIAEVACKRFLENKIKVKDIKIDSEEFENREGRNVRVSTIEIFLLKK